MYCGPIRRGRGWSYVDCAPCHTTSGGGGGTTIEGGGDKITDNNPTGKFSGNDATWRTINVGTTK